MSEDVNFLVVICTTNVPDDMLLLVFCYDGKIDEVESLFSDYTVHFRGGGTSIKSVPPRAMISANINGLDVPSKDYVLKLRYTKGSVFQADGLIVRIDCHVPQLMFKLDESDEILCKVSLAFVGQTSKVSAKDDTALAVVEASPVAKQVEESGSAAKQPKVDSAAEAGTSGVSRTSKTKKVKNGTSSSQRARSKKVKGSKPRCRKKTVKRGVPKLNELESLGKDIGDKWDVLGRRLQVAEELESIDARYKTLPKKGFEMLKHWTQKRGSSATYIVLSGALKDRLLGRTDLAEKYCYD